MEQITCTNLAAKYQPQPRIELNNCQLSIAEVNSIFEGLLPDIASLAFKPWYCKVIYKLGRASVATLAHEARKGNPTNPAKLFSALAKAEMEGKIRRGGGTAEHLA